MVGYSGTPLPRKLGIKPDHRVALLRAPEGFGDTLGELPDGVAVRRSARGPLDVIVSFTGSERELRRRFDTLARALDPRCESEMPNAEGPERESAVIARSDRR